MSGRHAGDGRAQQGTRNHAAVQPQPHSFVAQTESYRAMTIPWIRQERPVRRQVSWLAGHSLMHAFPDLRLCAVQWLLLHAGACASRYPLTVAGTAADLEEKLPHRIPD
jgi:hypothetical protein